MIRYFCLQLKRAFKLLPFIFTVTFVLLAAVSLIVAGILISNKNDDKNARFKIGITGDMTGSYVEIGLTALKNFDDTRFSMEIVEIENEQKARDMLKKGDVSAYVILPENFIERAMYGDIDTVTYVTASGNENVVSMFKNEVTRLISDMVVYTQKGTYGIDAAINDNGIIDETGRYMNKLSIKYASLVLNRSSIIKVEELGISGGLNLAEYYICGGAVLFIMLASLFFVTVYTKKELSLNTLLSSKGLNYYSQVLCETVSHFLTLLFLTFVLLGIAFFAVKFILKDVDMLNNFNAFGFALRILPVILTVAAFNIAVFEAAENTVNALLIHFFSCIALCYVSGCVYPVYALPNVLKQISKVLPTGIAREYLECTFKCEEDFLKLFLLLLFAVVFYFVAVFLRQLRTGRWHYAKTV